MLDIRRRQLIAVLGGAAAWPVTVRAQQARGMRRVGMLIGYAENDLETQARLTAFRQGLEHPRSSEMSEHCGPCDTSCVALKQAVEITNGKQHLLFPGRLRS